MTDVRIIGLGTANPPLRWPQEAIFAAYADLTPLSEAAEAQLRKIMVENQSIAFRHLGIEALADFREESQDQLIARYKRFAVPMAVEAAHRALTDAGLSPEDIAVLVVNTCTGYLCPGLTSYVAEALPLPKSARPFDLMGMGCGGALPNMETAYNFLCAHPDSSALSIAVEVCSATLFFSESPDILVSNAIFGDGAAAVVLTNRPGGRGMRLEGFASGLFPEHRRHLHYATQDAKLRNVLSRQVPLLGARCGKQVVDNLLEQHGLNASQIAHWVVHPGGQAVLDAFERTLALPAAALQPSREVLRNFGNMSSASVLFVLQEILRNRAPQPGELGLMCSFGAGFSAFATLFEFL